MTMKTNDLMLSLRALLREAEDDDKPAAKKPSMFKLPSTTNDPTAEPKRAAKASSDKRISKLRKVMQEEGKTYVCPRHGLELVEKFGKAYLIASTKKAEDDAAARSANQPNVDATNLKRARLFGKDAPKQLSTSADVIDEPAKIKKIPIPIGWQCPLADPEKDKNISDGTLVKPVFVVYDKGGEPIPAQPYVGYRTTYEKEDYYEGNTKKTRIATDPVFNLDGSKKMVKQKVVDKKTGQTREITVQARKPRHKNEEVLLQCDYFVPATAKYRGILMKKYKFDERTLEEFKKYPPGVAVGRVALEGPGGASPEEAKLPENMGFAQYHEGIDKPFGHIDAERFRKDVEEFEQNEDYKTLMQDVASDPLEKTLSPESKAFLEAEGISIDDFPDTVPGELVEHIIEMMKGRFHYKRTKQKTNVDVRLQKNIEYEEALKKWKEERKVALLKQQQGEDVELPPKPQPPTYLDPTSSDWKDMSKIEKDELDKLKGEEKYERVPVRYEHVYNKATRESDMKPIFTDDDVVYLSYTKPKELGPRPPKPGEEPSKAKGRWFVKGRVKSQHDYTDVDETVFGIFNIMGWVYGGAKESSDAKTREQLDAQHAASKQKLHALKAAPSTAKEITGGSRIVDPKTGKTGAAPTALRKGDTLRRPGQGDLNASTRPPPPTHVSDYMNASHDDVLGDESDITPEEREELDAFVTDTDADAMNTDEFRQLRIQNPGRSDKQLLKLYRTKYGMTEDEIKQTKEYRGLRMMHPKMHPDDILDTYRLKYGGGMTHDATEPARAARKRALSPYEERLEHLDELMAEYEARFADDIAAKRWVPPPPSMADTKTRAQRLRDSLLDVDLDDDDDELK